tara:strand:- start:4085 stop:5536 length:1452 start_codon:yes stop_codon:yes gene_type:complete
MNLETAKISEIVNSVQSNKISAAEVMQFFLQRARQWQDKTNAIITFNPEAEAQAAKLDAAIAKGEQVGPLAGIPVVVKDLLCTKNLKTTAGSKILDNFVPPYSSTVVERLENAGAIVLGKANLDEFAMGSSNETSYYGNVKNPWSLEHVPGGSSGGSAAAAAARMAPLAIGTDTGGSIRQPASFCNVVGLKPTYGRVSRYGIVAYASSLDQAGPMANYIEDVALALEVIGGKDPRDMTSANQAVPQFSNIQKEVKGLKIGLPKEYFGEALSSEVRSICEESIAKLKSAGAEFVDVEIPHLDYTIATYYIIATSEASSNLARYDGVRYGHRSEDAKTLEDLYCNTRAEGFGEEVKRRIMLGTYSLSSGYYDAYYLKACKVRRLLQNDFLKAFEKVDLLLSPVTTSAAFKVGERISDPLEMYLNDIYTTSTNLAGLPGMSVPAGFSSAGLPIGVQLTAPHFAEDRLFQVGKVIQDMQNVADRRPQ